MTYPEYLETQADQLNAGEALEEILGTPEELAQLATETNLDLEVTEEGTVIGMTRKNLDRLERSRLGQEKQEKKSARKSAKSRTEKREARDDYKDSKEEINNARDELHEIFMPLTGFDPKVRLNNDPEGTYTVLLKRPKKVKDMERMLKILECQRKKRERIAQLSREGTTNQYRITKAQQRTALYSSLIAQMRTTGDTAGVVEAVVRPNTYPNPQTPTQQQYAQNGGLLGHLDGRDQGQKSRLTKAAVIGAGIATIYTLYQALWNKKPGAQALIGLGAAGGLFTYIYGGKFKLPHQMIGEALSGGDTYQYFAKAFGLDPDETPEQPVSGLELEVLGVAKLNKIFGDFTYKELIDKKYLTISNGTLTLTPDPTNQKMSLLGTHYSKLGKKDEAGLVGNLYTQQTKGVNAVDNLFVQGGIKHKVIDKKESKIASDTERFQQRVKKVSDLVTKYSIEIREDNRQLLDDYIAYKNGVTWKVLEDRLDEWTTNSQELYAQKINDLSEVKSVISSLPTLSNAFGTLPVEKFQSYLTTEPGMAVVMIDRDKLQSEQPALYNRISSTQQASLDQSLTGFFGQLYAIPSSSSIEQIFKQHPGMTTEKFFEVWQHSLNNFVALEDFKIAQGVDVKSPLDPAIEAYIKTQFVTPQARIDALQALYDDPDGPLVLDSKAREIIAGIDENTAGVQQHLAMLSNPSLTSFSDVEKRHLAIFAEGYNTRFGNGMTMPGRMGVDGDKVVRNSYGLGVEISKNGGGYTIAPRSIKGLQMGTAEITVGSIDEAMQVAHMISASYALFAFKGNSNKPRERTGEKVTFSHNNSIGDIFKDLLNSTSSFNRLRGSIKNIENTDVFSEEAIAKYYPVLSQKRGLGQQLQNMLNAMNCRDYEQSGNEELMNTKLSTVKYQIEEYNKVNLDEKLVLVQDPDSIEVTIQYENPKYKDYSINLNLLSNDVGHESPIGGNDIEDSTAIAIGLLNTKSSISELGSFLWGEVKEIPTYIKKLIGESNIDKFKKAIDSIREQVGSIFNSAGEIISESYSAVTKILGPLLEELLETLGIAGVAIISGFKVVLELLGLAGKGLIWIKQLIINTNPSEWIKIQDLTKDSQDKNNDTEK